MRHLCFEISWHSYLILPCVLAGVSCIATAHSGFHPDLACACPGTCRTTLDLEADCRLSHDGRHSANNSIHRGNLQENSIPPHTLPGTESGYTGGTNCSGIWYHSP